VGGGTFMLSGCVAPFLLSVPRCGLERPFGEAFFKVQGRGRGAGRGGGRKSFSVRFPLPFCAGEGRRFCNFTQVSAGERRFPKKGGGEGGGGLREWGAGGG